MLILAHMWSDKQRDQTDSFHVFWYAWSRQELYWVRRITLLKRTHTTVENSRVRGKKGRTLRETKWTGSDLSRLGKWAGGHSLGEGEPDQAVDAFLINPNQNSPIEHPENEDLPSRQPVLVGSGGASKSLFWGWLQEDPAFIRFFSYVDWRWKDFPFHPNNVANVNLKMVKKKKKIN